MAAGAKSLLSLKLPLSRSTAAAGKLRLQLTAAGWSFLGLILCLFLMSINFSNNLIFAMSFLLVGIALVGARFTWTNLRGLTLADWRCEPVFAGQTAAYRLGVENRTRSFRYGFQAVANGVGKEQHLPPQAQEELLFERPTEQRGVIAAEHAMLSSCYPLGIFRAKLTTDDLPECLVYPKPMGAQPINDRPKGQQAHLRAESGSFTDMRRYAPGDPLSHIHWKAMARFDELYTKQFDGAQGQPALWLRWDDVQASGVEAKLSQLCRWVLDAHAQGREYGLELPGLIIEPGNEDPHQRECLRALALYSGKEASE
ncbi:DUF58 domain-containing protein [Cerasicoccus frondis]|uniref:DUF58 domain-containing protein n=1 Tax=Cerasicoccus frondis TaxID=490090 RepID=UPI002852B07C|nr:DUF58 domain-containing protein [Cerasicoccus frondis]